MIHRHGALPVLLVLGLLLAGTLAQSVRGPGAAAPAASPPPAAPATPAESPAAQAVLRALAGVQRAYDARNVERLCRPGVLVDPAVIRAQNARSKSCVGELESLIANDPRLQVTVRRLAVGGTLATADVATASGGTTSVDFVYRGGRWLLSFSDGGDPLPAPIGTA
jgi:hypothetical protein